MGMFQVTIFYSPVFYDGGKRRFSHQNNTTHFWKADKCVNGAWNEQRVFFVQVITSRVDFIGVLLKAVNVVLLGGSCFIFNFTVSSFPCPRFMFIIIHFSKYYACCSLTIRMPWNYWLSNSILCTKEMLAVMFICRSWVVVMGHLCPFWVQKGTWAGAAPLAGCGGELSRGCCYYRHPPPHATTMRCFPMASGTCGFVGS